MPAWGWSAMDCTNTVPLAGGGFGLGNCAARKKRGRQSADDTAAMDPLQHAKRFHKTHEVVTDRMTRLDVNETGAVPMQARSLDRLATSRPHAPQHRQQRQGALRSQCGSPESTQQPPQAAPISAPMPVTRVDGSECRALIVYSPATVGVPRAVPSPRFPAPDASDDDGAELEAPLDTQRRGGPESDSGSVMAVDEDACAIDPMLD